MANATPTPCAKCGLSPGTVWVWDTAGAGKSVLSILCERCTERLD